MRLFKRITERVGAPRRILPEVLEYCLCGKIGGDFASLSATHSVSDDVETEIVVKPDDIFIVSSYAPYIGEGKGLQHKRRCQRVGVIFPFSGGSWRGELQRLRTDLIVLQSVFALRAKRLSALSKI